MRRVHPVIPVTVFLLTWFLLVEFNFVRFPSPVEAVESFFNLLFSKDPITNLTLIDHTFASMRLMFMGIGIAFLLGVFLGILMGWYKIFNDFFDPIIELLRPIPGIAWFPIAIMFFGKYGGVFIVFLCAFFHILINTIFGVREVRKDLVDVARVMGANELQVILKVIIPSIYPYVLTGTRLGTGTGFLGLVSAEMISLSAAGLGFFIIVMHEIGHTSKMVAGMIMIGFVGFFLNKILLKIGGDYARKENDKSIRIN